ncbi:ragB/SusD family protein [Elizabethkingia sp. HvH-WGS333]|uniref:RagB/SusD family nutrient uptake outer membrane protein n=1 Tax=Elizabethkingia TaxID=308865 RepID=UPI0007415829|nr:MULTISPECIES: RagB/SusD family nutrient uptake outer membrane protein [Elizabethkingia]KUG11228.1 ragB/SusD family protein [Elizabethkingia miricola]MCL1657938.1 RagB/SusD family nutrient uptake outer membrane protein [Elizabethkingia miricola]OIK45489.1 ragB/SusD family protein [Elizabethkingia sp. HvH-WGS333]
MKKYILSITILTSALAVNSCNIEREPYVPVTNEVVKTKEGLQYLLNGAYRQLSGADNGVVVNMFRNGIFGGDEINLSGTTTDSMMSFYDLVRNPNSDRINQIWIQSYKTIFIINSIITNITAGGDKDSNHMLGEAHYLRALTNFFLLETFCKEYTFGPDNMGIPLKKTTEEADIPPRSTVGESYNFVLEDLLKAEQLMEGDTVNKIKASQGAVQALLARVYLYMGNNTKALEYANKVINSGKYTLLSKQDLPKYPQFVPESNSETIFAFRFDETNYSAWYGLSSMFATIDGVGWGEMYVSDKYIQHIQKFPQDVRNQFIVPNYKLDKNGNKTPTVYWTEFNNTNKYYEYKIYPANVDANGKHISFVKDGVTYPILTDTFNYGGPTYTKDYAVINGGKQYLTKEYAMNDRNGYPKYFMYKCSFQQQKDHLYSPIISRLAEMYLIRAEVNAKQGNTAGTLEDINLIRRRAGAPEFASLPADKTALDMVLEERWLEFAYEGQRKFDLVRNKMPIDRRFPGVHLSQTKTKQIVQPDDNDLVFYIPEAEMNRNPGMKQNP